MLTFKVDRGIMLQVLHAMRPGLSPKDIVEQSSSFVFHNGFVVTYNDEVACRAKSKLPKEFSGAVKAAPLIRQLELLKDDAVTFAVKKKKELILRAKRRESGVFMDAEITLPVENVDRPKNSDWNDLPPDFGDAIGIVQECAGKDESKPAFTCIHIHPKWVEACDNMQLARYRIKTGVKEAFIVKRDSLKHIVALDMTKMAVTESWVHFKNPLGVVLSCRRHSTEYPNLKKYLEVEGDKITIPKGLGDAVNFAQTFSEENKDDKSVMVELRPGKVRVRGDGVSGWGKSWTRVAFKGKAIAFRSTPKLLIEIAKKHNDCLINSKHIRADGGKWTYITCLGSPKVVTEEQKNIADSERARSSDEAHGIREEDAA